MPKSSRSSGRIHKFDHLLWEINELEFERAMEERDAIVPDPGKQDARTKQLDRLKAKLETISRETKSHKRHKSKKPGGDG